MNNVKDNLKALKRMIKIFDPKTFVITIYTNKNKYKFSDECIKDDCIMFIDLSKNKEFEFKNKSITDVLLILARYLANKNEIIEKTSIY